MTLQKEFKKEWPKIKNQLDRLSKEALKLTKKGEEQLKRLSYEGKLRSILLNIYNHTTPDRDFKKERLYYLLGKAYIKSGCPGEKTAELRRLINEFRQISKDKRRIKSEIQSGK